MQAAEIQARRDRGAVNFQKGRAAEEAVVRCYVSQGARCLAQRWRNAAGEIDLIFADGHDIVFVEVKASRSFDDAAAQLLPKQMARIFKSAEVFLETQPAGSLTPSRIDVALVDGHGQVRIIENAFQGL